MAVHPKLFYYLLNLFFFYPNFIPKPICSLHHDYELILIHTCQMSTCLDYSRSTSLDELESIVERLRLRERTTCCKLCPLQDRNDIVRCNDILKCLLSKKCKVPTAGGLKLEMSKDHPDWSAQAWIDGRSEDLEEALKGKTFEKCQEIEQRSIELLNEKKPKWEWEHHHHQLHLRLKQRKYQKKIVKELSRLPQKVSSRLVEFKSFIKGQKFGPSLRHDFTSRQKMLINDTNDKRKYGYICYETKCYLTLVDKYGAIFKKSKCKVKEVERWRLNI